KQIFSIVAERIETLGGAEMTVGKQISSGRRRKFGSFWLYNVTKKDPNGVPHLMLALDHERSDGHVRNISRIGKHRWNHQIVVRSVDDAQSDWLGEFLALAYDYGAG